MKKALGSTLAIVMVFALAACAAQGTVSEEAPKGPDEALIQQIDAYFTMTKDEILEQHGPDYEVLSAGPEGVCDGYCYEELGMTFAFYPDEDALEMIECDENFKICGVGVGSLFSEIIETLGENEIKETWIELPIYTAFVVEYRWGATDYNFVSFDQDGPVDSLWIFQRPSFEE